MKTVDNIKGRILEIQRMSTEDGPGIRTTVFLKGCTLKCSWCHNPESIALKPEIQWIGSRCIGCQTCTAACPHNALKLTDDGMVINRDLCDGCGICADKCPSTAMELLGTEWDSHDLAAEMAKDEVYFKKSGGGVTIGGGESTLQPQFVKELLTDFNSRGIHTALDTCGLTRKENLDLLLPLTDLVLLDLKEMDSQLHKEFTGAYNEKILEHAVYISEFIKGHLKPKEMWIRTPLVPGANGRTDNIKQIGAFIAENLSESVTRWELLAFNNLCKDKYSRLGIDWIHQDSELLTQNQLNEFYSAAIESGVNSSIVHITGASALEEGDVSVKKSSPFPRKIQC